MIRKKIFNYTGSVQTFIIPYKCKEITIECYGSVGQNGCGHGGYGGYSKGTYIPSKEEAISFKTLYIYVGNSGGWNGGGQSGASCGGGATDVRTVKASDNSWYDTSHSSWDKDNSLLSRIIVAGGGGGSGYLHPDLKNTSTTSGINNGDGYVIITYNDDSSGYILEKDNKFYIPKKDFYNEENNEFTPVTSEEIINYMEHDDLLLTEIDKSFNINSKILKPSDIIDFTSYKLVSFSYPEQFENIEKINIKYEPSQINLSKSYINIINKIQGNYKRFIDIDINNKSYIDYSIDAKKYNKTGTNIDLEIVNKYFYLNIKFNNKDAKLSKIYIKEYENFVLNKISSKLFTMSSNILKTKITFKKDYYKIYINMLTKHKYKYSEDTLETF